MRLNSPVGSEGQKTRKTRQGGFALKKKTAGRVSPAALLSEHFLVEEHAVSFAFYSSAAGEVFLAGSFNDWNPRRTSMKKGTDGIWRVDLVLKPGMYEYRFVVDGLWLEDLMSERFVANPFGGLNSAVVVKD